MATVERGGSGLIAPDPAPPDPAWPGPTRSGIICAGNWIVDIVHTIDGWPRKSDLVHIRDEVTGIGGGAFGSIPRLIRSSIAVALLRASSSVISSVPPKVWRTVLTSTLRPRWPTQRSRCILYDFPVLFTATRRSVTLASRTTLGAPSYFRAFTAASVNFSGIPHSLCEPCGSLPANRGRNGWERAA